MSDIILAKLILASYIIIWFTIRFVSRWKAKPTYIHRRSPIITIIVLSYVLAVCLAFAFPFSVIPGWTKMVFLKSLSLGTSFLIVSILISIVAIKYLGSFYSFQIEIKKGHTIVTGGPYKFIRHPIYLAEILGFIGVCFIMSTWFTWLVLPIFVFAFYRMATEEERALSVYLKEDYLRYKNSTKGMFLMSL